MHFAVGSDLRALTRTKFSYTGGPPTTGNLTSLAAACRTAWTNRLAGATETNTSLTGVVVTDLASVSGAQGTDATVSNGTRAGGQLPAEVCALVNHSIARRYRGGKPKTYQPAGTATDVSGPSNWTAAFQSYLQSNYLLWISDIISTTGITIVLQAHVNVSYFQGFTNVQYGNPVKYRRVPSLRAAPVVDTIVTSTVNLIPSSQRRRMLHSV